MDPVVSKVASGQTPLSGRKVAVVGLGHSGLAAMRLARRLGAEVIGLDSRDTLALPDDLKAAGVEFRLGAHTAGDFAGVDLVVVSPGIPPLPLFDALQRGLDGAAPIEVIGEFEFATRQFEHQSIVIGGTNGKSTTTTLV